MKLLSLILFATLYHVPATTSDSPQEPAPERKASKPAPTSDKKTAAKGTAKGKPAPKASSRLSLDEPRILSAEEAAKRSESLRSLAGEGTATSYDATDWSEVPPWRQTTFYGVRAKGQTFVYVVDCSGSMIDEDRLLRAKRELRRTIGTLQFPQRFKVIFYNDEPLPMPGDLPKSADTLSKDQLNSWLRLIEPDGGTDPRLAMKQALSIKPDAIFLLSDGAFPDGTAATIVGSNRRKIPIHCIDLSGGAGGDQLKAIATASGGHYQSRP